MPITQDRLLSIVTAAREILNLHESLEETLNFNLEAETIEAIAVCERTTDVYAKQALEDLLGRINRLTHLFTSFGRRVPLRLLAILEVEEKHFQKTAERNERAAILQRLKREDRAAEAGTPRRRSFAQNLSEAQRGIMPRTPREAEPRTNAESDEALLRSPGYLAFLAALHAKPPSGQGQGSSQGPGPGKSLEESEEKRKADIAAYTKVLEESKQKELPGTQEIIEAARTLLRQVARMPREVQDQVKKANSDLLAEAQNLGLDTEEALLCPSAPTLRPMSYDTDVQATSVPSTEELNKPYLPGEKLL